MAGRRNNAPSSQGVPTENGPASNNNKNGTAYRGGGRSGRSRGPSTQQNLRLIFSQIVALQCFHYLILGFIIQCNHVFFSTSITVDRIFTDKYLNVWSSSGWVDNSTVLISYLIGAALLAAIVEKSKKCLDFSVTLFLINLSVCTCYAGVPATGDWWIVHLLGTIIMIVLGEYLCSRRELLDIPLL